MQVEDISRQLLRLGKQPLRYYDSLFLNRAATQANQGCVVFITLCFTHASHGYIYLSSVLDDDVTQFVSDLRKQSFLVRNQFKIIVMLGVLCMLVAIYLFIIAPLNHLWPGLL